MTARNIAPSLIGLVVGLIAGYVAGALTVKQGAIEIGGMQPGEYERGYAAARAEIEDVFAQRGLSYGSSDTVTKLYGFVTAKSGDVVTVEYDRSQFSVLESGSARMEVRLGPSTDIGRIMDAETAGDAADAEDAEASAPGGGTGEAPTLEGLPTGPPIEESPEAVPQVRVTASASDVRVGQYVEVDSATDLRGAQTVSATALTIHNLDHLDGGSPDASALPFTRATQGPAPAPAPGQ